jgi:hypothetical protein
MTEPTPWHRLFGLGLVDFFRGMPISVELEMDLSLKKQLLDVVVINKHGFASQSLERPLPDGFDALAAHNLVTFKSHQQSLDPWSLHELIGHYVNYRKQISPSLDDLLPEAEFRLFAVCVRSPQVLARLSRRVQEGVLDVHVVGRDIRVIVVNDLPCTANNSLLHLFSARLDLVRYGTENYRQHSRETSTLLRQLLQRYRLEAAIMPTGLEQLQQLAAQTIEELLSELPPEELLKRVTPEDRVKGLTPDDRVKGLTPDDLLRAMSPELRRQLRERLEQEASGGPEHGPETTDR